jgi:hypothetical protein
MGWSVAATIAAYTVAARVVHASNIDAANFGMKGDVASETTVGARGTSERVQVH